MKDMCKWGILRHYVYGNNYRTNKMRNETETETLDYFL